MFFEMNDQNKKYLWKIIQLTGDCLINKLPDHPHHPSGRNPYAHVALKVKNNFGLSYKDLHYEKFNDIIEYLNLIKRNEG